MTSMNKLTRQRKITNFSNVKALHQCCFSLLFDMNLEKINHYEKNLYKFQQYILKNQI